MPLPRRSHTSSGQRALLILGLVVFVVVLIAISLLIRAHDAPAVHPAATPLPSPAPTPLTVPSPLDGQPLSPVIAYRRPIAIMIENYAPDARPQSGLGAASIVYETLTEGGITRFMALYLDHSPSVVGPVRSARPYFVRWAAGYRAIFAHAGGSPAAEFLLYHLSSEGGLIADVNGLLPYTEFYRSADRLAPHNLYTSIVGVRRIAQRHGWNHPVPYIGFLFKAAAPLSQRGQQQWIRINFSTSLIGSSTDYAVTYRYDRLHTIYRRWMGSEPHIDRNTGHQIAPTNVVILFMPITPIPNDPELRVNVANIGHGRALFFHDGHVYVGEWRKRSTTAPLVLLDRSGRPERLDAGQTWIEAVPATGIVQYGP
jgi:hypothetical protein